MNVRIRKGKLALDPEGHRLLTDLIGRALEEQARQSISGSGGSLVGSHGNFIDLRSSGDLWSQRSYTGRGLRLNVEYASYLAARFDFTHLAPQTWEQIKPQVRQILKDHLTFTEA